LSSRGWLVLFAVALLLCGGAFLWIRAEGAAPEVRGPAEILVGVAGREVELSLHDRGSGLRQATVALVHAQGEQVLLSEDWPGSLLAGAARGEEPVALAVRIESAGLPRVVKDARLRVSVRDWSWRGGLGGNVTLLDVPVQIDREPPRVSVATGLTYVRRGGSGVVVYSVDEQAVRDGVDVAGAFFPGHPLGEQRIAIYAVPTDAPERPEIRVVAEDGAANVARARWPVVLNERELPHADVRLPESFLEDKVVELARGEGIDTNDLEQAFHSVNSEVRARNEARIRELVAASADEKLWDGPFEQLENSQVTSRFAERRRYLVGEKPVSQATHFGYDLASTAAAPITASARGRVVFADQLGIYGNCVLIDHGLGVASLYGHLSRVDVAAGDGVERGQRLGLSGATGLAGGDHLHFAILVGGFYVDPLEWWDPKWMQSNVDARIPPAAPVAAEDAAAPGAADEAAAPLATEAEAAPPARAAGEP
jgi:murein DD-endopeptidase MepM/ murein hydrolase activator NlpD